MAKKRTLICIHVMPNEIEMFERFMMQMYRALHYLDDTDDVTEARTCLHDIFSLEVDS